jgi:hypothetical protein
MKEAIIFWYSWESGNCDFYLSAAKINEILI